METEQYATIKTVIGPGGAGKSKVYLELCDHHCCRKVEEPEIKLPTSTGSLKKQESSRKTSISALLTTPKPFTV